MQYLKSSLVAGRRNFSKYASQIIAVAALSVLGTSSVYAQTSNPQDPFEGVNRSIQTFNDALDGALIKPITLAYQDLTPKPARTCIRNIFNNLSDIWSATNSFLQAQGHDFFNTLGRVLFNTTMGLGGCIDVATMNGAHRIHNDLGVTLGVWGLKSGPYLVLPIIGSSTVRDGMGLLGSTAIVTSPTTALFKIKNVPVRNSTFGLYSVNARAGLLEADELISDIALDRYSFIRDAYLQRRESLVSYRLNPDNLPDYSDDLPNYSDD